MVNIALTIQDRERAGCEEGVQFVIKWCVAGRI